MQTLAEEGAFSGERGTYRLETTPSELHISPTVQGVLAARIDRLAPDEKALLQQLAVIGRQFPVSLIKQVVSLTKDEVYRLLFALQAKEFLYEQPAFPEVEYLFKHALTQEVAYGTVLQEQRKVLHEQTGRAIEQLYQDKVDEHYSALAHHYSRTENAHQAVTYLHLAGQQAAQRSAYEEAVKLLTQAIGLVQQQPATADHRQQELALHTTLGPMLVVTKGYAALETERVYTRAHALCEQVGDATQLFPIVWGLHGLYITRADYRRGQDYGEQLLALAHRLPDPSLVVWANRALGEVALMRGEFSAAVAYGETHVAVGDLEQRRVQAGVYGEDPVSEPLAFYSHGLFVRGYPDRAQRKIQEALMSARELAHGYSMAFTTGFTAWQYVYRREPEKAKEHAEATVRLATEQGVPFWRAVGTIFRGWALGIQGQVEAGVGQIREGLAAYQATGAVEANTCWLALLAEVYGRGGHMEEGLAAVAEALAFVDRTDERFYEAELHRLKGILLLQDSKDYHPEAASCFRKALHVARQQEAKSFELRTATSLARLWQQQGKANKARDLLAPVYDWFTEGFDTADLKDAKALLEEIS